MSKSGKKFEYLYIYDSKKSKSVKSLAYFNISKLKSVNL